MSQPQCPECGATGSFRLYQHTLEEWDFSVEDHEVALVELIESFPNGDMGSYIRCLCCSTEFSVDEILDGDTDDDASS